MSIIQELREQLKQVDRQMANLEDNREAILFRIDEETDKRVPVQSDCN